MKCFYLFMICSFLFACSTNVPSEEITKNVVNDLVSISVDIEKTVVSLPKDCVSETVKVSFDSIKNRVKNVEGQVKSISLACSTEKKELKEKITNRELIILFLFAILVLLCYTLFRGRK